MRNVKQWQLLVLALGLFVVIGWQMIKPDVPEYPPYVSHSPAQHGVKALYTWLMEKEIAVSQWKRPWELLPEGAGQLLVLVQPMVEINGKEREHLEAWVVQGNDVLWLDVSPPDELVPFHNLSVEEKETVLDETSKITHTQVPGNWSAIVRTNNRFTDPAEAAGWTGLFGDDEGYLAVTKTYGAGRMTVGLVPEWATNRWIASESHLALLGMSMQVNEHRAIWFDEFHHGMETSNGVWAVTPEVLKLATLPLLLATLLLLWRSAVRFGVAHTPRSWQVRRGDETLLAVGGWYAKQHLTTEALQWQQTYIRSLLTQRFGLRHDADEEQIMEAARNRMTASESEQLADLLTAWREAEQSNYYTDKAFVRHSQLADGVIIILERM